MRLVGALLAPKIGRRVPRPPPPLSPSAGGSLGLTLFIEAQASISVPSTEKCSLDSSRLIQGWASTAMRRRRKG